MKKIDLNKEITTPEIELKPNSLEKIDLSSPIFKSIINEFITTLKKNFKEEDLKNFYNNISKLKLKNKKLKDSSGQYKINKNEIIIEKNLKVSAIRGVLYHELFHMASSAYKNGRRYSGFSQRTKSRKMVIGNGLNEGYTEVLAHRHSPEEFAISYPEEYNIVLQIENFIGKEEMAKLYLNADLNGLINKLKEYSDEYEIAEFIMAVDLIQNYYLKKSTRVDYQNNLKTAYRFIVKTYIKKQEQEYSKNNITKQEFADRIGEYVYNLKKTQYDEKHNYISLIEIIEILETVLGNKEFNEKINQKLYSIYNGRD